MAAQRAALASALLLVAVTVQLTAFSRLPLPGATPDLVLVAVVALALAFGPATGAVSGFGAGLTLDIVPPADHAVGRYALVLCLVGYLAGLLRDEATASAFFPVLVVGVAAVTATGLSAWLAAIFGREDTVTLSAVLDLVPTAVLYDMLLAPFVVPLVFAATRRIEPETLRW